jgi:putative PIG3 family NAD(P)H quinone oxidoreductase
MKAILVSQPGDASCLSTGEVPAPSLGAGQVRVRVRASGVNRADIVQREGKYPPPPGESEILGLEIAGEILEVGRAVTGWRVGDRVIALVAGGGYAEEVCVDSGLVMRLPERLKPTEGAAIPEAFLTAYQNLYLLAGAERGGVALIHAGASGVGTAAIQLLRETGIRVFCTVGTAAKAEACRRLGAEAIVYREKDFAEVVRRETQSRGVDIILDPIGSSYWQKNFACLALGARWIFIATLTGREVALDLGKLMQRRAHLIGSTLRSLPLDHKRRIVARFQNEFLPRLESGALQPIVDRVFPAAQVREAHGYMEENRNIGKIVLEW